VVYSHGQPSYFAVGVVVGAAFGRVASAVLRSAVVVVLVGVAVLVEDTSDFVACVRAAFVGSAYRLEVELKFDSEEGWSSDWNFEGIQGSAHMDLHFVEYQLGRHDLTGTVRLEEIVVRLGKRGVVKQ
jgi:hypothetical protein